MGNDRDNGALAILGAFLLGGIIGAGIALLTAPQSGEETRRKIKDTGDDLKRRTGEFVTETRERVEDLVEKGKGLVEEKRGTLSAAFEAGKDAMEREKARLTSKG